MQAIVPFELNFFADSPYEEYKDFNPERTPQTCEWFLQHAIFQRWKQSSHGGLLWLSADPGCGKSVLSRTLIDEKLVGTEATICYFFFKDGNVQQDNCAAAMCALLHRLFSQQGGLLERYAEPMWKKYGDKLKLRFKLLWELFVSAATDTSVGKVVCILDALDETLEADRKELIGCLGRLYNCPLDTPGTTKAGTNLKFFVTSRPYRDIQMSFYDLLQSSNALHLAVDEAEAKTLGRNDENEVGIIGREILHHIQKKIKDLAAKFGLDPRIAEALHNRFCQMPHRTYLWAHLMLEELENVCVRGTKMPRDLAEVVDILPKSIEDAYEKLLNRCDRATARPLLEIIIAAQRPLRLHEIDVALHIQPDMASSIETAREGDQAIKEWVRTACGSFVQISDGRVFLIHQTAREFLMRKTEGAVISGRWRHSIGLQEANHKLAVMCITQLLLQNAQFIYPEKGLPNAYRFLLGREMAQKHSEKHPFLEYSVSFWALHVREAGKDGTSFMSETETLQSGRGSLPDMDEPCILL